MPELIASLLIRDSERDYRNGAHLVQGGGQSEFTMPIPLRPDFDAAQLRLEAKRSKDGAQARRLLALAAIYNGATRTGAAAIGS